MRKYYCFFNEGSKINQIICAVLINMPVFTYGSSVGWMSPMTLLLQSENSPAGYRLSDNTVSMMGAVAYLISVFCNFLVAFMGDRFGKKPTLLFISSMGAMCWIIKLSSYETWAFLLARICVGFIMSGSYVTCPLYTKEISQDCIRGLLGSFVILFHTSGNLFLYIIGDVLSYRTVLWICLALPTLHLVLFMSMPESPSFLLKKGKHEEAVRVLAWLRCRNEDDPVIQKELDDFKAEIKKDEESDKCALKAIVSNKLLFRAFRIALIVTMAREVCGAIPILNFAGDIFSNASKGTSLVLTPNQQAMMLGAVQVAGSALASSVVEKAGRKPLLISTSFISGLSMCGLASWFLARQYDVYAPAWLPVVTLCICIFCDAAGLCPVSIVMCSEIFSYKYRGIVMAISMSTTSFADFLQMLFFKPLANAIGIHVAFFFFGIVCLVNAVYVIFVVPETKMRCLEEIYEDLKTKKEKRLEATEKNLVA